MPDTPDDAYPRNPKPSIIAWLRDRRLIAIAETNGAVTTGVASYPGQTPLALYATLPDLRQIDWVIDINLFTDPSADMCLGAPFNKKISGNIVGFTVVGMTGFATGTTVFAEVCAVGPP